MNTFFKHKALRTLGWFLVALVVIYFAVATMRMFYFFDRDKTDAQIVEIHAGKITLDDVLGKNLPSSPGAEADKTIVGVDSNANGIRDDVELAIFEAYPDSARMRAPLLQYAFAFQKETVQPFLNMDIVTEIVTEESRADECLSDELVPRKNPESSRSQDDVKKIESFVNFVRDIQFNTDARKTAREDFLRGRLGSFGESTNEKCDINSSLLSD
jgi:hypothetical protein